MPGHIRYHRLAALVVLVVAGAWVATGKFSAVGSEEARAAQKSPAPAAAGSAAGGAQDLPTVAVTAPVYEDHSREIVISGATAPDKATTLAARAAGIIHALPVRKGARIAKGALVMRLEGPEFAANVATAEALLAQRRRELSVAEKLNKSGNTSDTALTAARSALAAAEAQLSQAKAAADRLELSAPFDGVVGDVPVELGEWVQAGTPIAKLLSLDPIVVKAEVSETDIGLIHVGSKAQVRLIDGRRLQGKVRFVAAEASAKTRTFPVEVALSNPGGQIPAGMTAELTLFAPPVQAISVRRSVITLSGDGTLGVRAVGPDDVVKFIPVKLIDDTPDGLIITGVPRGMRVIVSGQDMVKDGARVTAVAQPAGKPLE
ncbi:hemolysin D [Allgaiera indica]|uniref:Hemolysin D n=1 Tax=Allgaiera indica TaxID=765699 RepID=A0AAN4UN68_9RHOB|nr:efflux RND transporter periplasmic adaptor subunit [Allgaiera indica]GHD98062.1 hemolysin D [Allgaiera indica]SDW54745.1 membrane fusion protein, multidrug efflux system [Allgaiera indica]